MSSMKINKCLLISDKSVYMENYGLFGCLGCISHKNKNKQMVFYHNYMKDY